MITKVEIAGNIDLCGELPYYFTKAVFLLKILLSVFEGTNRQTTDFTKSFEET